VRGDPPVPRALAVVAAWSWRLIVIAAAAWLLFAALSRIQVVVLPVAGALLLCTFLAPIARWLRERGLPRALAAMTAIAGAVLALGGVVLAVSLQVRQSIDELDVNLRGGAQDVEDWLVEGPLGVERARIREVASQAREWALSTDGPLVSGAVSRAATAVEVAAAAFLLLVLLFFFLKDGDRMWSWLTRRLGAGTGRHVEEAGGRAWWALGGYMRGQAVVAAVDALFIGLGIFLLGVPLAIPLAIVTFLASFFPIVGAVVAGALAVLVALAFEGLVTALMLLAVVVAVQQIEGNVLEPLVIGTDRPPARS
jgi:predicted PurR-regulated permease PerM